MTNIQQVAILIHKSISWLKNQYLTENEQYKTTVNDSKKKKPSYAENPKGNLIAAKDELC